MRVNKLILNRKFEIVKWQKKKTKFLEKLKSKFVTYSC